MGNNKNSKKSKAATSALSEEQFMALCMSTSEDNSKEVSSNVNSLSEDPL